LTQLANWASTKAEVAELLEQQQVATEQLHHTEPVKHQETVSSQQTLVEVDACQSWQEREECPRLKDGSCAPAYKPATTKLRKCHGAGTSTYDGTSICSKWHGEYRKALNYSECELVKELNDPYPRAHSWDQNPLNEHLIRLLAKTRTILDQFNITWWLDYSTALGALRDGKILPHDRDADISIMVDCRDEVKAILLKELPKVGGWLELDFEEKEPPELEMTIRLREDEGPKNTKVDVYVFTSTEQGCLENGSGNPEWRRTHLTIPGWSPVPDSWVFPLRPCHVEGIGELPCPNQNAKLLKFYYGYIGAGDNTCAKGGENTHSDLQNAGGLCERIRG
jgi:hypothetical protein